MKTLDVVARFEDRLLTVAAGPLQPRAGMGGRTLLGNALRIVPRRVSSAVVSWDGANAGALAPIRPAVTFGFSSVPAQPGVAGVRTTVVGAPAAGD